MKLKRTHTDIIAKAMDVLARDIESHDGVANAAIGEAAQRLRELQSQVNKWEAELGAVMPADFKDWHQNDPLERPAVARWAIENLRRQVADTQVRLDAALDEIERWRTATAKLRDASEEAGRVANEQLARADAELAALRWDKERLDWMEASPSDRLAEVRRLLFLRCETARESIDAAMKGGAT